MPYSYDVFDICPEGYNLLSNLELLAVELGYPDVDDMLSTYEMTASDIAAFKTKLKYWPDLIPSGWGTPDTYVVPIDLLTDEENALSLDLNEYVCNGETGAYHVLTLSTEAWGML